MSTLKVGTIQNTSSEGLYPARVWVNFNQTGTQSIYDDEGVSAITDAGVGLSNWTFSPVMPNTNWSFNGNVNRNYSSTRWDVFCTEDTAYNARTTSFTRTNSGYGAYAELDFNRQSFVLHGDLT